MSMAAVRGRGQVAVRQDTCPVDPMIAGIALALLAYGLVMVGSASMEVGLNTYGNPFHLLTRHVIYLGIAGTAAIAVLSVPVLVWQRMDMLLLGFAFFLLVLVLVPGVGKEVNGSTRWISLGLFTLQGSEFVTRLITPIEEIIGRRPPGQPGATRDIIIDRSDCASQTVDLLYHAIDLRVEAIS